MLPGTVAVHRKGCKQQGVRDSHARGMPGVLAVSQPWGCQRAVLPGVSPATPCCLLPAPATSQVPGKAKLPCPTALPERGMETCAKLGQGVGWGSRG